MTGEFPRMMKVKSPISLHNGTTKRKRNKKKATSKYTLLIETVCINLKAVRVLLLVANCLHNFVGEITGSCRPVLDHFVQHVVDMASSVLYNSLFVKVLYPCSPKFDYFDFVIRIGGVERPLAKGKLRFDVVDNVCQILGDV